VLRSSLRAAAAGRRPSLTTRRSRKTPNRGSRTSAGPTFASRRPGCYNGGPGGLAFRTVARPEEVGGAVRRPALGCSAGGAGVHPHSPPSHITQACAPRPTNPTRARASQGHPPPVGRLPRPHLQGVGRGRVRELAVGRSSEVSYRPSNRMLALPRPESSFFAALARLHGPMVQGACRRLVRHAQDAEDSLQTTSRVLAQRAGSVRTRSLARWLYSGPTASPCCITAPLERRRLKGDRRGTYVKFGAFLNARVFATGAFNASCLSPRDRTGRRTDPTGRGQRTPPSPGEIDCCFPFPYPPFLKVRCREDMSKSRSTSNWACRFSCMVYKQSDSGTESL
jgi:hypothetical protein